MTSSTHPQKNCFHCGLEVPEHLHLTVRFEDEEHETCCAGCQAVAQSIIDAGLGKSYNFNCDNTSGGGNSDFSASAVRCL